MQKGAYLVLRIKILLEKLTLSLVLFTGVFVICFAGLVALSDMVFEDKNQSFDEHIFSTIRPFINDANTGIMEAITFFGSPAFLIPANILLILFFLFVKKLPNIALRVAAISVTSTVVLFLLKAVLGRERPLQPLIAQATGYSFPSGHTFSSVVFFGMLAYTVYKNIKSPWVKWLVITALILLTGMVGLSRVYLKLHFASDVIVGFCLGIIWLFFAKLILFKTAKKVSR